MKTFDLIIIGGGSGGIATANRAASYGTRVALVEEDNLGGTCVNRGCVPKKVMWYAASIKETLHRAADYGFNLAPHTFSWEHLKKARDQYIERLNGLYTSGLDKNNVTLLTGHAHFIDQKTIEVNKHSYQARHILIATGGQPIIPDIPGAELGGSSDDFFEMKSLPKKSVIIGAGYISVELACVLNTLGSETHLCLRHGHPLRTFDDMIGHTLLKTLQQQGVIVHTHTQPTSIVQNNDALLTLNIGPDKVISDIDRLFWAIGRRPYLNSLGTEKIGLKLEKSGHIHIDKWQQTNLKNIYAVGDVTLQPPLTPVAIAAGRHLADRLFGQNDKACLRAELIPTAVFTHPPIATVGLTEQQAIAAYGKNNLHIYHSQFTPMYYALSKHRVPSKIKMVTLKPEKKVIGFHIIGKDADEIIQGVALAMQAGVTYTQLQDTIAVHPTSAEEIVLLK